MDTSDVKIFLQEIAKSQAKTHEHLAVLEEKIDRIVDCRIDTKENWESLYDSLVHEPTPDEIANEFFCKALSDEFFLAGIQYDFVDKNAHRKRHGIEDEYDIFMVNGKDIAIIEVKYKAHEKDLDRLVHKKYENFKKLFPEYRNFNHHLALASFKVHDKIKEQAKSQGVMVLQRRGDVFKTSLPD